LIRKPWTTVETMKSQDLLDTRESPEYERWAVRHILACKPQLIRVVQKSDRLPVPPENSWLGRVDAKTNPFPTSEQVRLLASVAAENLREVDRTLAKHLPLYSLYSLIRAAVESSSIALWLLEAKSEDLAASRTLRVHRQNVQSDRTLWQTVIRTTGQRHQLIYNLAEKNHQELKGVDHASFQKAVLSTAVIQNVDRNHPYRSSNFDIFSGLEVWRLCSAVAHANQFSIQNILERHPNGALGESTQRTSRLSFVAGFYSTALHRTNTVLDVFEKRSRPRRTNR